MRFFATLILFIGLIVYSFYIISRTEPGKLIKLKTMLIHGLVFSILFTLVNILGSDADIIVIGKGLLLGSVMSTPYIFHVIKRHNRARIINSPKYYKAKERSDFLLWFVPLSIVVCIVYWTGFGSQIVIAKWPLLSMCFFWIIQQVFSLLYNIRIEKKTCNPEEKSTTVDDNRQVGESHAKPD